MYEKALGFDYAKPKHIAEQARREEVEKNFNGLTGQIHEIRTLYQQGEQNGDLSAFFKKLDIPEEKVLQHVLNQINYSKLPPEQRQILDARRAAETRALELERNLAQTQAEQGNHLGLAVQMMLDQSLGRDEVKTVAEAFDARVGKPGAFREEVANRGDYYWRTTGKLVPPEQVVQEILKLVGPVTPAPAPNSAQVQTQVQTTSSPQAKVPVIPNIGGRTTSPIPQKAKSIAELKEIRKQF